MKGCPLTGRAVRPLALAVLLVGLVPNRGGAQSCTVPSFTRTDFEVGSPLDTTAVGDFNWDGRPDVVSVTWAIDLDADVILLQLGDGTGGFGAATRVTLGSSYTNTLAVADINRDGHPDIVAASNPGTAPGPNRGRVTVLLATGPGSFGPPIDYDLSYWVNGLAVADFNTDGRLDAVTSADAADPIVLLGNGDGTFTAGAAITLGSSSGFVLSGDFNRDGHADLVFTDMSAVDTLAVVLGNGDGTFGPRTSMGVLGTPSSGVVADFNKDGVPDLFFWAFDRGSVFLGTGAGSFTGPTQVNLAVGLGSMASVGSADFDRDGTLDLAINTGGTGGQILAVLPGDGAGGFGPATTNGTTAFTTQGLSVADVDRDGRADVVVAVDTGLSVFRNESGIACSAPSFGPALRAFSAGNSPYWTVSADFNGDGKPDLATTNYSSDDVTIHLGDGAGALVLASTVAVGTAPIAAIAPDLNGDGRPDLVTANYGSSNLSVRLGNGAGGFSAAPDLSTGDTVFSLVAADFNSDGRTDLVASNPNLGTLSVFFGNGDGTFTAPVSIPLAASTPVGLALADLNRDGRFDVVVADWNGAVWLLTGNGAGGFSPLRTAAPGTKPYYVDVADFNGDDRPDVLVSNQTPATVSLFMGNGSGGLGAPTQFPTLAGTDTRQVAAVDVNGDRRPDVVLAGMTSPARAVFVLLGDGVGGLGAPTTFTTGHYPASFAAADFTGDGVVDLAVAASNVAILAGNGAGGFEAPIRTVGGASGAAFWPLLADINRDGKLDLVARISPGAVDFASVYLGDGAGGFVAATDLAVGTTPTLIVADLDGNGTLDLATANKGDSNVSVVLGNGDGTFGSVVKFACGATPMSLAAVDLDRDGRLDLVVAAGAGLSLLRGLGGGNFAAATTVAVTGGRGYIAVGDLNRDGIADLVMEQGLQNVAVLLGNGAGGFGAPSVVSAGTDSGRPALADLDRDGSLDLVVGSSSANVVSVLRGDGAGGFGAPALFDVGFRPLYVAIGDVNADGKPDIVASGGVTPTPGMVSVLLGDGAGGFSAPRGYQAGAGVPSVALGDVNRDGRTDIVTANGMDDSFWTLLNTNCRTRGLLFTRNVSSCNAPSTLFASQPVLSVVDDGANVLQCAAGDVTASLLGISGTPGATLGGTSTVATLAGVATYTDLSVDLVGSGYQLLFAHAGARKAWSRRFNVGDPVIAGPIGFCQTASAVYDAGAGYDSYAWRLDGGPVLSTLRNLTLSPLAGLHALHLAVTEDDCSAAADLFVDVTALLSGVGIAMSGAEGVCPTCSGGTASVVDTGGGSTTHQWGYRLVSGGAITVLGGKTGTSYLLNGSDFPGAGLYYLVVTTTPSCGSAMVSNELPVSVYTTMSGDAVVVLTVRSRDGENTLEWLNPAIAGYAATRIQYNEGASGCSAPSGPFEGTALVRRAGGADAHDLTTHTGLVNGTTYCYAAFVEHAGLVFGAGRGAQGRPFDTTGAVKWAFSTGATTMAPPAIGPAALFSASNDLILHGMVRGLVGSAGLWPSSWKPYLLNEPSQHRMGVASTSLVAGASRVAFLGEQDGYVYAVNADSGAELWRSGVALGDVVETAPVGMFVAYGGIANQVYAGSVNSTLPNSFYALDTASGAQVSAFDNGGGVTASNAIGAILGGGAVDYSLRRVYFTSRGRSGGSDRTLWCLGITASGLVDDCGWPPLALGDIDSAPTLRNGILYVGNNVGTVYAIEAATGAERWRYATGDGAVKGFIFPDRNSTRMYFATQGVGLPQPGHVWGLSDEGPGAVTVPWPAVPISAPSIALFKPGGTQVLVGSEDGRLYQLELSGAGPGAPTVKSVALGDGSAAVGSPSYDPYHDCIYVGSEAGVIYAVTLPLP
jgi:hypothetical protein